MEWEDALALGPTKLSRILGCPLTTAHSWIRRSGPPEWQKDHFLRTIKAEQGGAEQPATAVESKAE
jgi:hypothetical protein